ncbi:TIGR03067 domain-containing protein [Limnoglobus roseus]|uniref:TIGR03067 domain-containing protein n=1 Tax=Limnoglobus roseus TaxID=2598579 RepID=A0A5C1AHC2_9BACT|nr:TIGR03067 domain-containing protein [Limnoglobus roseus]QEL18025.1 TIGR03067 domain-containing protein [Limnoglobus roseus]
MKSVRTLAFAALVALVLPLAAEDKKEAKFDAEKMSGDWTVTAGKKAGQAIGDDAKKGAYTITKDKITLKEGDKTLFVFSYTLDTKASPVAIDMEIAESAIDGIKGTKAKGIVELTGDELKLTYDAMGGDRPKKFDDDKAFVFTLKKKK